MSLAVLVALALVAPSADSPSPTAHAAAVCADFTNQAAAQRARNTRDPDHDGIFCESLSCPCSRATGKAPAPAPRVVHRVRRSIQLGPVSRRSGCEVRGRLPDPRCTPGARLRGVGRATVCRPGYSESVRHVTESTKNAIYAAYGITIRFDGQDGEVDHLVSLELGGSNARANLFPEASPGSHEKNRLENRLHDEVCDGRIGLRRAQRLIATDWVAAYRARFG